jgi:hypothetical protein
VGEKPGMIGVLTFAVSAPCRATARGCPGENIVGTALIVFVVGAAVAGVLASVWFRWERGPFWVLMRLLNRTPSEHRSGDSSRT